MWIRYLFMILFGLASGLAIAAGFVAFITLIGVFAKMSERTSTSSKCILYENCIMLGAVAGNIVSLYQFPVPIGYIGLIIVGMFGGIFVGCLAGALSEVLNIFPILERRLKLRKGLPYVIVAIAIGKVVFTYLQYYVIK